MAKVVKTQLLKMFSTSLQRSWVRMLPPTFIFINTQTIFQLYLRLRAWGYMFKGAFTELDNVKC